MDEHPIFFPLREHSLGAPNAAVLTSRLSSSWWRRATETWKTTVTVKSVKKASVFDHPKKLHLKPSTIMKYL